MQIGIISLIAQIPQAAISATELYSKHPYLACFLFAAVLLVLLAFKVRGGGASDRFQVFDYRPWSWRRFWERRDVAKEDALDDIVCDRSTKHRVVRNVKRQVDAEVRSAAEDMGLDVSNLNQGTVMWGNAGVGKTALLVAVAQVLSVAIFMGRGDGDDREKRRVFAHLRSFRGPRRRVTARLSTLARGGGGVFSIFPRSRAASARVAVAAYRDTGLFICLSYEREGAASCLPSSRCKCNLVS